MTNDQTDLIVSIKCEMSKPEKDTPNSGKFTIEVELFVFMYIYLFFSSPSMVADMDNRDVETMETELSYKAQTMLAGPGVIDTRKLCVMPGNFCWNIYADIMVFNGGGNLLDAISIGVRSAALTAVLPRVDIVKEVTIQDGEEEIDDNENVVIKLSVEEDPYNTVPIPDAKNLALCLSCGLISGRLVADPTTDEEACSTAIITAAISPEGAVVGLTKTGSSLCNTSVVARMVRRATIRGKSLVTSIDEAIRRLEEELGTSNTPGAAPRWGLGASIY